MGNSVVVDTSTASEESGTMISPGSVSGALSSLWSTSSDQDDTCVKWGLVGMLVWWQTALLPGYYLPQSKKERIIGFFCCLCLGLICFGLVSCVSRNTLCH